MVSRLEYAEELGCGVGSWQEIGTELEWVFTNPAITHSKLTIAGSDSTEIKLTAVRPKSSNNSKPRPAIYFIHGGGLVLGNRFLSSGAIDWIKELDAGFISVEYRLVPGFTFPIPLEDCFTGLKYVADNAKILGVDANKIMVAGKSGGGNLAAGVPLLARDRGGPKIHAQLLIYAMRGDRMESASSKQFYKTGTWTGEQNSTAWDWYLGWKRGGKTGEEVSAGSPNTWIDVGSADLFRDGDIAYASKMWECGGRCELHVWPEAWQGFDGFALGTELANVCLKTKLKWMKRALA
ncbi:alpha/beta hydrolase fold protein [Rhexocercosporidium sp. MPI-PUGE-AT-0058]|nr:alpha/beta hydrolase fold protein [Rhexocercosporidium sp. MPI-PUGE-AT-0058]